MNAPSNVLHTFQKEEEVVAIGNIFEDSLEIACAKAIPDEQGGELTFGTLSFLEHNKSRLSGKVFEEVGSIHRWAEKENVDLEVSVNRLDKKPVKIHTLPAGESYLLMRVNHSTKLLKLSKDGNKLWEKVFLPELPGRRGFPFEGVFLAVSSSGNIAVSFKIFPSEYSDFLMLNKVISPLKTSETSVSAIVVLEPTKGSVLHVEIVEENVNALIWLDLNKLVAVISDKAIRNRTAKILVIQADGKEPVVRLPLPVPSSTFQISVVQSVSQNRLLIGAAVGYEQVSSGSVVSPGHVLIGLYDMEHHKFVATERIRSKRDTLVTALEEIGKDDFLLAQQFPPGT